MIIFMCKNIDNNLKIQKLPEDKNLSPNQKLYENTIVITNRNLVEGDYLQQLKKIAKLHPYGMILREKDLENSEYERLALEVKKICDENSVQLFIHTNLMAAEKICCKNLHLSFEKLKNYRENPKVSALLDKFENISVSCHSLEEVLLAEKLGGTQIVLGTIFETQCKKGLKGKGLEFVKDICKNSYLKIYAIGGINFENLPKVMEAGAKGGCMMSGYMRMKF